MKRLAVPILIFVTILATGCTAAVGAMPGRQSGALLSSVAQPGAPAAGECTYGKGYWTNHPEEWPVDSLTLGGVGYDQDALLAVLQTPPAGDATYNVAHHLIPALLNIANGTDAAAIAATIAAADAWLAANPLGSNPQGDTRDEGLGYAAMLESYNEGEIGPGSCDDLTPTPTPTLTPTITVTPTVTITPTLTVTPTVTITPTITVTPIGTPALSDCTGADPHPQGTVLAARFAVDYEEIMGWFCAGFGFGEIDRAYEWGLRYEFPVEEIFEMRRAGQGWGQIRQILEEDAATDDDGEVDETPPGNSGNGNNGNGNNGNGNNGNNGNGNGNGNGGNGNNGNGRGGG